MPNLDSELFPLNPVATAPNNFIVHSNTAPCGACVHSGRRECHDFSVTARVRTCGYLGKQAQAMTLP